MHQKKHRRDPLPRPELHLPSLTSGLFKRIAFILMVLALVNLLTVRLMVEGASMQPNFHSGQFVLVSRLNYMLTAPRRGDVAVFHLPSNVSQDYVKRIIGIPFDTLEIRQTVLYINGQPRNEPYIKESCDAMHCPDGIWQLGADDFFVMGDNRNDSNDSRYFGVIKRDLLVGQVVFRYFPFSDIGWVGQ